MDALDVLVRSLSELDEPGLARLLAGRQDVTRGVPPRSLDELAGRLWHPHGLVEALRGVALPSLQVLQAAHALGNGCTVDDLAEFLAGDERAAVTRVVGDLTGRGVAALDEDGRVALPPVLEELMPDPLGLGRPMAVLLEARTVDEMRRIQTQLGQEKQKNRAATVAALVDHFADRTAVAALLADAPEHVRTMLRERTDDGDDIYYVAYDQSRYRLRQEAVQWATARGLLVGSTYGYDWQVPGEVARALRGPSYRAPFNPEPPVEFTRDADRERVERDAAAAASDLSSHLLAVLDHLARVPVGSVKSGGVGARELTRLAKACDVPEVIARLVLELAHAAGLVGFAAGAVTVSPDFAQWRALEPAEQYAAVLRAWWQLGRTPTETRDADDKPVRALSRLDECEGCRAAREALVRALRTDRAADRQEVADLALWQAPFVHLLAQDENAPFAAVWREAELLGVLADGALTSLGRALRYDSDDLVAAAAALLPASSDCATFGSDLTAFAVGAPSARLSTLLDSVADRESRGGAITWRFTPATVRRALDDGATGDSLLDGLAAIASGELPQPLRYLLNDIARQHGNLRLRAAACCVRSEDDALLAQVAADRKLAKYGLRLVAPTVLVADVPLEQLLHALRAAGYYPALDSPAATAATANAAAAAAAAAAANAAAGAAAAAAAVTAGAGLAAARPDTAPVAAATRVSPGRPAVRTPAQSVGVGADVIELFPRAPVTPPDAAELAARLLRAPAPHVVDVGGATEQVLSGMSRSLSRSEIRQLAHAIESGSRVAIEYRAASGNRTRRIIDALELEGATIYAWCELRQDERMFSVSGIVAVAAV